MSFPSASTSPAPFCRVAPQAGAGGLQPAVPRQLLCDLDEWFSISVDGLIVLMTAGQFEIGSLPNGRSLWTV